MMSDLPPFLPFFIAAFLALPTTGGLRKLIMLAAPIAAALQIWFNIPAGTQVTFDFIGYELIVLRADKLSLIFGYLFAMAGFMGMLFAWHVKDLKQDIAALVYVGSTIGAVFAGDLLTLFVFWELMALSSVIFIWSSDTARAYHTGLRYLIIQVLSGVFLLAGTILQLQTTGSLVFEKLDLTTMAGGLIFLAFGIKAAFPFLHTWLTESYPEATATGTVFLSVFTTKLSIYALARGFAGEDLLIYIGLTMMVFPAFYAVIENDLRKTLSYSLINQLGFMVTGIGIGTALSLNGTVAHAFSHVIYEALLFMGVGAVIYRVGHCQASDLGGLYKFMPKTALMVIIGALSISAFPLFSGFISKSMVLTALLKEGYNVGWLLALFASAGVAFYAGIKIPYYTFFTKNTFAGKNNDYTRTSFKEDFPKEAPMNMLLAMGLAAVLCILIGIQPQYLYAVLPWKANYWPYDTTHVLAQLQLLFFTALAFVILTTRFRFSPPLQPATYLDVEWFYRKLLPLAARGLAVLLTQARHMLMTTIRHSFSGIRNAFSRTATAKYHLSESWPTGSMVLWISLILATYLVLDIFVYD